MARQSGLPRFEAMILQELSSVALKLKNFELAQEYAHKILKIYKQIEDRLGYGYALRQMGDIHK
ncbi:MAG: hypothetical protein AAGD96_26970, partial [Chloroflexota bacterium]